MLEWDVSTNLKSILHFQMQSMVKTSSFPQNSLIRMNLQILIVINAFQEIPWAAFPELTKSLKDITTAPLSLHL